MKVAVIGAGGVGGYFGGRLAAHGHDVAFLARGAHLQAMQRDGLTIHSPDGDVTVSPVRATDDPNEIGPVDQVLLCVKTWQLDSAIAALEPLVGKDTAVVTVQNGVEAPDLVADAIGRPAVVPGIAKIIAFVDGPGRIRHLGGSGSLTFAEWDNSDSQRVLQLRQALADSKLTVVTPQDIWTELWAKFLFVVPIGTLGAVTDATFGSLRTRPGTRQLLVDAMAEIEQVARANGVALPADIVTSTTAFLDRQPEQGTTSLHRDIVSGKPSELEAWTGSVVRLGAAAGVPTPVHNVIYQVLSLRAAQAQG